MKHLNLTVYGRVQRVFFRASTKAVADQLGVKGLVTNRPDGTVYIEAEGDDFAMENFLEWCHEGPINAKVEKVETSEGELKNYRNFEVVKKA
ncbi:acylphosphatase [Hufsiella ginkgonis]|uniref:acylphosphatase n=1 Tax=Hufsiella ginkgonis TaxID=2695274 RepID=A0A7K1Y5F9_9SPHI|nr:acylphosphatase [Hufsiella ginkgonis]MXV17936.1 acylphosphatase [Hufsiella ginkgonis]